MIASAVVVCLTGYTGRKNGATIDVPRRLAHEGIVAIAPDQLGFGEAEGERWLHSVRSAYDWFNFRARIREEARRRIPPEEIVATYERCGEPEKLVFLPGARHNHVYEFSNSEHFENVAYGATEWFRHYL